MASPARKRRCSRPATSSVRTISTLTFTIRQGVKWSDGQAFDAKDVAFTFNLLKQFPAADSGGLWTHFTSVDATDANTVVIKFDKPAPTLLPTIEGTYIVPQHLWATVGDPVEVHQHESGRHRADEAVRASTRR